MKKLILLGFAIALSFTACQQPEKRYTQQSPEIDTVKKIIENYNNNEVEKSQSVFADTSKTFYNTKDNPMSLTEVVAYHKNNATLYTSRMFTDDDPEYEMVVTDDGETWVNCWLDWKGTLAATNEEFDMPVHLTYRFVDGKIVREVGMFDISKIALAMQAIEVAKSKEAEKNAIPEETQS